jgi:3-isopropylmalate/(R)-2-methylmalate dehydratase small subunit
MTPLTKLTAIAAPLLRDNIDTDAIIPSREMKSTGKAGLADGLFASWRYQNAATREPDPTFVLNQPRYANARILLGGTNFGCGSSREHAVWALAEFGIRVVVAASFAPIFAGNCIRNGLLPAVLPGTAVWEIAEAVDSNPRANELTVDVAAQTLALPDGRRWNFPLGEEAKSMLLDGVDAIDLTLKLGPAIAEFHARDRLVRPWVYIEKHS